MITKGRSRTSIEIKLRTYKEKDYNSLRAVLKEADMFYPTWDNRNTLKQKLSSSPGSVIVAVKDDKVIGCVYVLSEIGGSLAHLAVKADFRGQGIGEQLLRKGEDFLKKKGVKEVTLFVDSKNTSLHSFYKKRRYVQRSSYLRFTKTLPSLSAHT